MVRTSRGQAPTLEAIIAVLIILSSLSFAISVTAVTPLTSSTTSQYVETQQNILAEGVIQIANEQNNIRQTLFYWNESGGHYYNTSNTYPSYGYPPETSLGNTLEETFVESGIAVNLNVYYYQKDDRGQTVTTKREIIYMGAPTDSAVTATERVVLYDSHKLYNEDLTKSNVTVKESDTYYIPDKSKTSLYNIVTIEVIVWKL